jgi:oxygen-independent coproporphyrinogen-3 oxidase
MLDYIKALGKEINSLPNRKIGTIFIGGGTPTYLNLECWRILKDSIDSLNKDENIEFSVEMNPGTVDKEKLKFLKRMGVNRLSIGLQAWQNKLLKKLGRIHQVEDFIEVYNGAREAGFNNINIDIMFGLPDQSMKDWKETLDRVVELNPEHISCYSLIIEDGTAFHRLYEKGMLNIPSEEVERDMYSYCIKFLKDKGYNQYEISNFSKKDKECKHNLIYWELKEYIGCGAAAHSYIDEVRYRHTEDIEKYIYDINNNEDIRLDLHKNSLNDDMEEFMFMGLRKTKGINIDEFQTKFNRSIIDVYGETINKYLKNNLLIMDEGNISLSPRGIDISNSIMCDFILE